MRKPEAPESLGPLPGADVNAELERRSVAAFIASLPADKFLFRDERAADAGVDGSLELLVDSKFTNLRSQVQLKSTSSPKENQDGSITVQVRASNLNYLLNGPSPLYVLYIAPRGELRFAWARDERRRLDQVNPGWMEQTTVAIRFVHRLTTEALEEIHEYIKKEGRLDRRIHDLLGSASAGERVITSIDPTTLENTDPDEVYQLLLTSGATIVSAGYGSHVRRLVGVINPARSQDPRIQLVRAYAEYSLGRFQAAQGLAAESLLRGGELSSDDRQLAAYIRDACDYQTGHISVDEYSRRLTSQVEQQKGVVNASYVLSRIRYALHSEKDPVRCAELTARMRAAVAEILNSNDFEEAFKLHARVILLETEGQQSFMESMAEFQEANLRQALGRDFDLDAALRSQRDRWDQWERAVEVVLRDAEATNNPLVIADALATRGTIRLAYLTNCRLLGPTFNLPVVLPEEIFAPPLSDADKAINIYKQAEQLEGELRASLLRADLLMLAGREADAKKIARDVLPKAQVMNYAALQERARDVISDHTLFKRCEARVAETPGRDTDYSLAEYGPELLLMSARRVLRALDLPE
jgi:tetratricopeptide (TPR) repeat protein